MNIMQSVLVTGASTGIGWGCVKVLIKNGYRVFGGVRKQADADRLAREFGSGFTPALFDVTNEADVAAAARMVARALGNGTLAALVNNAGIAVPGPLLYLSVENFTRQIAVNLTGQLIVTQAFAPLLGVDRSRFGPPGRIVMMSSVSGKTAWPFLGAYSASKFALEGLSDSLRRELMPFSIDVIVIGPGAVATPIWDKAEALDVTTFGTTPYNASMARLKQYMVADGRKGLPPERVGEAVLKALTVARPKTRYTVTPHPVLDRIISMLPKRALDRIVARQLALRACRLRSGVAGHGAQRGDD
jgi:NAD(P)-dependent dehydrogenase (short-subunit alcohol dehydrogenase family)